MADPLSMISPVSGIVQLVSSTVRVYEDVFQSLRRWKRLLPDLERVYNQVRTLKTVFRTNCRLMLASFASRDMAKEMIERHEHPAWADPDLDIKLSGCFGNSGPAYVRAMLSIEEKLLTLSREIDEEVHIALDRLPYSKSMSKSMIDKFRRSKAQRKRKAIFLTTRLSLHIEILGRLNLEFQALSSSTSNRNLGSSQIAPALSLKQERELEELQFAQKALMQLHHALILACNSHREHSTYFRLEPDQVSINNSGPSVVNFSMALTGCDIDGDLTEIDTNQLAIISAFYDPGSRSTAEHAPAIHDPVSAFASTFANGKEILHKSIVVHNLKTTEFVRFHTRNGSILQPARLLADNHNSDKSEEFPVGRDFCFFTRSLILRSKGDICIGYLEEAESTGIWRHLFYVMPRATIAPVHSREPISLAQLYNSMSLSGDTVHISLFEKVRLARQIAVAVLRFYSTPFLKGSWGSEDVIFLGIDKNLMLSDPLAFPHLSVRIINEYRQENEITNVQDSRGRELAQYPHFLRLGIVLIELAYCKPFSSLRESADVAIGEGENLVDFWIARRLSKTLDSMVGIRYAEVVRKCLYCATGQGNTLDDPELRVVLYQDCVCELEQLEECFSELKGGGW